MVLEEMRTRIRRRSLGRCMGKDVYPGAVGGEEDGRSREEESKELSKKPAKN